MKTAMPAMIIGFLLSASALACPKEAHHQGCHDGQCPHAQKQDSIVSTLNLEANDSRIEAVNTLEQTFNSDLQALHQKHMEEVKALRDAFKTSLSKHLTDEELNALEQLPAMPKGHIKDGHQCKGHKAHHPMTNDQP